MKRILYAGGSFITGDRIAAAVLDYAAVLANAGRAAKLEVPALDLELRPEHVAIVVGPASQLMAESVTADRDLDDERFLESLQRRIRILQTKSGTADGDDAAFDAVDGL